VTSAARAAAVPASSAQAKPDNTLIDTVAARRLRIRCILASLILLSVFLFSNPAPGRSPRASALAGPRDNSGCAENNFDPFGKHLFPIPQADTPDF
jgi:hypothetical protein